MTGPGGPLRSGTYRIVFSCTACKIGELEVTTPAAVCCDVVFTPDSDDLASAIQATGMTCTEAEALVRKAGPQTVIGSARFQLDGSVCARTAQSDRGLPSVDFECTSGPKKVTFTRT